MVPYVHRFSSPVAPGIEVHTNWDSGPHAKALCMVECGALRRGQAKSAESFVRVEADAREGTAQNGVCRVRDRATGTSCE